MVNCSTLAKCAKESSEAKLDVIGLVILIVYIHCIQFSKEILSLQRDKFCHKATKTGYFDKKRCVWITRVNRCDAFCYFQ